MTIRGRTDDAPGSAGGIFGRALTDVADRLRRLPESRLNKLADAGRELAQALADAAAGVEARDAAGPPPERVLPALSVFAVADQVSVTGHDLTAAMAGLDPATAIWWQGTRRPLSDVLAALTSHVERIRAQV